MIDALKTEGLYLTLPVTWLEIIDNKATGLKTRQDIIREAIEIQIIKKWQQEA